MNCVVNRPFNSVGALERAKRAVEQHYAVVGILEDLNSTLTVLERYVPRFFAGASQVYWGKHFSSIRYSSGNPPLLQVRLKCPHTIDALFLFARQLCNVEIIFAVVYLYTCIEVSLYTCMYG